MERIIKRHGERGEEEMRWYRHLYMGKSAEKDSRQILTKMRYNRVQMDIYAITLASNPQNLLDIYPSHVLRERYYRRQNFLVIGIARGYEEAVELAAHIVIEVYKKTGGFRIQEYLKSAY